MWPEFEFLFFFLNILFLFYTLPFSIPNPCASGPCTVLLISLPEWSLVIFFFWFPCISSSLPGKYPSCLWFHFVKSSTFVFGCPSCLWFLCCQDIVMLCACKYPPCISSSLPSMLVFIWCFVAYDGVGLCSDAGGIKMSAIIIVRSDTGVL